MKKSKRLIQKVGYILISLGLIGTGIVVLHTGVVPGSGRFGGPFAGVFLIFLGVAVFLLAIFYSKIE